MTTSCVTALMATYEASMTYAVKTLVNNTARVTLMSRRLSLLYDELALQQRKSTWVQSFFIAKHYMRNIAWCSFYV